MSARLLNSFPFRFMRWRLGIKGSDAATDRQLEQMMVDRITASDLDAAVVLAFDAVYDRDGRRDVENTHLYVSNDYVEALANRHANVLYGCSVHPYRTDAAEEVERCVRAGAVLVKWLPIVQGFNPADERCFPVYDVLAHHGVPLLSHTGGEQSLPRLDESVADPMLLEPALKRGVTVIAAHCGTRSRLGETDYLPQFVDLARRYERCYGDTAALSLPTRWYAYPTILKDRVVREKLVHGSDWPIPAFPPPGQVGVGASLKVMGERDWLQRDIRIKRELGFDEAYWRRAGEVIRKR
jgi:predicted TIM-barrel fold metal-dependent hydrolase